jgi:hypothetical protein
MTKKGIVMKPQFILFRRAGVYYCEDIRVGRLRQVAVHVAVWHVVAIGLAVATARYRNRMWGLG